MKTFRKRLGLLAVTVFSGTLTLPLVGSTSASKNGITWTFDRDYTTGQYANGDPWVVGPIVITGITPVPEEGRNGTMVNPQLGSTQGFDDDFIAGYNDYVPALNVGKNLPLAVAVDSSVVSSITADAYTSFNTIQMFSILTVVKTAPAPGSFRPPAVGNGSRASAWKESQLDYSKLNSLPRAALSAVPSITEHAQWFSYPWLELNSNWTGEYIRPSYMGKNGYGRDIARRTGDAALLLNLDFTSAQKRDLLVGMVQVGIDNYGFISQGGSWYNDGGHNIGRLAPLIVAAGVLNDGNLKNAIKGSNLKFQEFQNTFFVSQADVDLTGRTGTNGQSVHQYSSSDIGMPEWGIRHTGSPQLDNNFWGAQYRDTNGSNYTAVTMAAKAMGLRSVINWEPLFQYAERHLNYEQSSSYAGEFNSNPTPLFHKQFYNNFNDGTPPPPDVDPPPSEFAIGSRIEVGAQTNIRISGALTATLLGTQPAGSAGLIIGGPIGPDSDGITWWEVDWDNGTDGWSGEDNFLKEISISPSPPQGLRIE